ncbi:MAG: DUF6064 family protein [Rhodothermales bacterium]
MSEWWTYRLSDFLLFSADTYYRLFELYNLAIWPAHMLVIVLSIWAISILVSVKPWSGRILFFLLAASWFWVAWGYHVTHFATINWAASYFAIGFALQGVLLLLAGVFSNSLDTPIASDGPSRAGIGLAGFGLVIQPLIGPLSGRPWTQVELFGIAPDPTAIVTLGLILMVGRFRWILLPIPIIWCWISSATLWTMGKGDFWIMAGAALIALVVSGLQKAEESHP